MAMDGDQLADEFRTAEGFPPPTKVQAQVWGEEVVNEIKNFGATSHASGAVTGIVPPTGGPLIGGAASGGTVSGLSGARIKSAVTTRFPFSTFSAKFAAFCDALVDYVEDASSVEFAAGKITGVCTNTLITPGVLVGGTGVNGTITSLVAADLAEQIRIAVGAVSVTTMMLEFAQALVDHVKNNAEVSYSSGQVTGVCTPGGGSLSVGAASGGAII